MAKICNLIYQFKSIKTILTAFVFISILFYSYNQMSHDSFAQNLPNSKPLNINISFNIAKKQVTHSINHSENQKSINNKKNQNFTTDFKSKQRFSRPSKIPQSLQTDRKKINQDFQFIKPTEEFRRKKNIKRSSADYTFDKNSPLFNQQLDQSLPIHKRGYTISFTKKSASQTVAKKKKFTKKVSSLDSKNGVMITDQKQKSSTSKSLKAIINKMINSEMNKQSLSLHSVPIKSKYNRSTVLISRKICTQKQPKKRSSKSQIINRQKSVNIEKKIENLFAQQNLKKMTINKNLLLEKLGNFKSFENSLVFCEADKIDQEEEKKVSTQTNLISELNKRIVIKTDQSIECIDEIHNLEKDMFKKDFFLIETDHQENNVWSVTDTKNIIQTYLNLLEKRLSSVNRSSTKLLEKLQKQDFQQQRNSNFQQYISDDNRSQQNLNHFDLFIPDDQATQTKNRLNQIKNFNKPKIFAETIPVQELGAHKIQNSLGVKENSYLKSQICSNFSMNDPTKIKTTQPIEQFDKKVDFISFKKFSSAYSQSQKQQNELKPSFQMAKQHSFEEIEKSEVYERKKLEIQQWVYLLDYVKSNLNNQASARSVLEQVYEYLSSAQINPFQAEKFKLNIETLNSPTNNLGRKALFQLQKKISEQINLFNLKKDCNSQTKKQLQQDQILNEQILNEQILNEQILNEQILNEQILNEQILNEQILNEQIRSFKGSYQSESNNEDIKFLNLQTIESAFKNRLKNIQEKKEKQTLKLEQAFEQTKITKKQYDQQKKSIQKWFKAQINQILSVKKSIWKGYHEAQGILNKCHIVNNFSPKLMHLKKNDDGFKTQLEKLTGQKSKKMMKCLSENYLKKKNTHNFLVMNQRRQFEPQKFIKLERQNHSQLNDIELDSVKSNSKIDLQEESDAEIKGWQKNYNEQLLEKQYSAQYYEDLSKIEKPIKQIKADLQQIPKKEDKIVQNSPQQIPKIISKEYDLAQVYKNQFSPAMILYEQTVKDLASENFSDNSFNFYPSSQQSDNIVYHYEDQKSIEVKETQQESDLETFSQLIVKEPAQKLLLTPIIQQSISLNDLSPSKPISLKNESHKQYEQKLKLLAQDDKEDIFQFLFLDLCIELYQEPSENNKIMNSVNEFIAKKHEMSKRKKGIKTNLNVVKDYLKRICGYILRTNKQILTNVNVPMGPTAKQMLRYMHQNDTDEDQPIDEDNFVTLILPISLFDNFQRSLLPTMEFDKYYENEDKEKQRIHFLKNLLHIHNKALFDALNQYLDHERPFGIWGASFPWKKPSTFTHVMTQTDREQKLKKSAQKVVQACSYVCGLLADKEESLIGNARVSEAYIEQIRQDRISRMLANDMVESEERWLFYDDEETEVLVESANKITNKILADFIDQLGAIKEKKMMKIGKQSDESIDAD